jgi:hypothetical protein
MPETITGGCKCGRVTYSGERAEADMFQCYCRDCQQLTGTGHANMVPLQAASFTIGSGGKEYAMIGGSGRLTFSIFCPECGSPLVRRSERMSDRVYVHAASMDRPDGFQPARWIYTDAARAWDTPDV